jgi:hypothetical protein
MKKKIIILVLVLAAFLAPAVYWKTQPVIKPVVESEANTVACLNDPTIYMIGDDYVRYEIRHYTTSSDPDCDEIPRCDHFCGTSSGTIKATIYDYRWNILDSFDLDYNQELSSTCQLVWTKTKQVYDGQYKVYFYHYGVPNCNISCYY